MVMSIVLEKDPNKWKGYVFVLCFRHSEMKSLVMNASKQEQRFLIHSDFMKYFQKSQPRPKDIEEMEN
jgi:hypothetical protein